MKNCPSWLLTLASGVLLGLNAPGRHTQLVGMVALFPLFVVIDRIQSNGTSTWKRRLGHILLACWGAGSVGALLGVPWLTYAARVFGGLPQAAALLVTAAGYGTECAFVLFVCFGLPVLLIRRRGCWELAVRLSYLIAAEPFCPRIFYWSFGGMTFSGFPLLCQLADVIGSPGLGIYSAGFSLLLLLIWRSSVERLETPAWVIRRLVAAYIALWAVGLAYGAWRVRYVESRMDEGSQIHVAAVQPNFSLADMASRASDYSARESQLLGLLRDSKKALGEFAPDSGIARLVIWPESAYPAPYFQEFGLQLLVERFARQNGTYVLLQTIDWDETSSGRKYYGIAVLIGPDGRVQGRYDKIFRIPFGEYIPGAELLGPYAKWLRKHIANLSEFEKGREFTVFRVSDDLRLCAPICFDAFSPTIIRNMSRSGANMAVNLANLMWFGRTTAPDHLEMTLRWRAIEHRISVLLASNSGASTVIDAGGKRVGERLRLFERGTLSQTVCLRRHFSIYRDYSGWVHLAFASVFACTLYLGQRRAGIFRKRQ